MNSTMLTVVISSTISLLVAVLGHLLGKQRDREAEWRKFKLEYYKEYMTALSGTVGKRSTVETQIRYSDSVNSMQLVAPPSVVQALHEFMNETSVNNPKKSNQRHDELLMVLIKKMRRDVHPAQPNDAGIQFHLMNTPPLAG